MRKWLTAAVLCLLALFCVCLASHTLVERPALLREESQQTEQSFPLPVRAALAAPSRALAEDAAGAQLSTRVEQTRAASAEREQDGNVWTVRETDGNGIPLRARSYVRAVYRAFPPEKMPG